MTMQMQQTIHQEEPVCRHCGEAIHETQDPNVPYVHDFNGNSFCDVLSISDAATKRGTPGRTEAEPLHLIDAEYEAA